MTMPLRQIVNALGGDIYDGGRRANIPYPGHSRHDRSVSLYYNPDTGKVVAKCFAEGHGDGWKAVLDDLHARGLTDRDHKPTGGGLGVSGGSPTSSPPPANAAQKLAAVHRIWDVALPARRTLAERHARIRHIVRALPSEEVARFNRDTPASVYDPACRYKRPALLLAVCGSAGDLTGLEITYLQPNARRVSETMMKSPRQNMGVIPASSAVRVDAAAPEMLVAEGFFTTLSATERFQLPGWALLSVRNLKTWDAPEGVRSVLVAGDNQGPGREAAEVLVSRLRARGLSARAEFPPEGYGDWNDVSNPEKAQV